MKTIDEQAKLEKYINLSAEYASKGNATANNILGYLLELQDRRESDLMPVTKFTQGKKLEVAIFEQFKHIESEVIEAKYEVNSLIYDDCRLYSPPAYRTAKELIDIQTSCETMLEILGYNEKARRELRKKVITKNTERGYFDE